MDRAIPPYKAQKWIQDEAKMIVISYRDDPTYHTIDDLAPLDASRPADRAPMLTLLGDKGCLRDHSSYRSISPSAPLLSGGVSALATRRSSPNREEYSTSYQQSVCEQAEVAMKSSFTQAFNRSFQATNDQPPVKSRASFFV